MGVQQWLSISTHWRRKWPTSNRKSTTTSATKTTPPSTSTSSRASSTVISDLIHRRFIRSSGSGRSHTSSSSVYFVHQWIYALLLLAWLLVIPSLASEPWDEVRWNYEDYSQVTRVPLDPVFLPTKNNITVREGGNAALPCKLQHQGTKRVAWRRVDLDKFLTIGELSWDKDRDLEVKHVKPSEELDEWTLILPRVSKKDAGLYECQVTSVTGFHTLVRLNVVGPRLTQPAVHMYGTKYVGRGDQINLTCNATGGNRTADDVDWFKDGNIIGSGKDYVILKYTMIEQGALVSTLHVDRAKQEHAGTYVCRSSHGELDSIAVQVLVTDSSNVKRDFPANPPGTVSSSRGEGGGGEGDGGGGGAASLSLNTTRQTTIYVTMAVGVFIVNFLCVRTR